MGAVFVSYRRGDSEGQARALFNDLADLIGKDSVFMDVDGIALGRDFRQILQERLGSCDLMLALIGPDWLDIRDAAGNRRLESAADFVRQEIAAALKRNIPVTPVLVRGAQMPAAEQLPDDLKDLAYRNGFELSHTRWDSDVREMIKRLGLRKTGVQEPQQGAIVAPGAGSPVATEKGPVVTRRTLGPMRLALSAAVAVLVLVSLVAWFVGEDASKSGGQGTTLGLPPERTPAAPSPKETTIKSLISKEGGTSGRQRSPQLDHDEIFETTGALKMEFEFSPGSCSKARLHIFIDGTLVRQTDFFDGSTGVLDLGPLSSGRHILKLSPEGLADANGCNIGTLESWGGTLTLRVGA